MRKGIRGEEEGIAAGYERGKVVHFTFTRKDEKSRKSLENRESIILTGAVEVLVPGEVGVPLVLALLEVLQDVVVAPAGVAEALPLVEVPPVASDVEHGVEDRAPADDLKRGEK